MKQQSKMYSNIAKKKRQKMPEYPFNDPLTIKFFIHYFFNQCLLITGDLLVAV